jgi:hypothetical protein
VAAHRRARAGQRARLPDRGRSRMASTTLAPTRGSCRWVSTTTPRRSP